MGIYPFRCEICGHRWRARRSRGEPEESPAGLPASFSLGQSRWEGRVKDLSTAGCMLETDAELPEGLHLQIELRPPDTDPPITVERAAVRSRHRKGLVLEFVKIQDAEQARLRKLTE